MCLGFEGARKGISDAQIKGKKEDRDCSESLRAPAGKREEEAVPRRRSQGSTLQSGCHPTTPHGASQTLPPSSKNLKINVSATLVLKALI